MQRYLTVIYGPGNNSALARQLARGLPGQSAVVSVPALLDAIVLPDPDAAAELEMVHIQLRLLVANFLKSGYSVVVEGPFIFERDGALHSYDSDIEQLVALMRNLSSASRIVHVQPESPDTGLVRLEAAYKHRSGERYLEFEAAAMPVEAIAAEIRTALLA